MLIAIVRGKIKAHLRGPYEQRQAGVMFVEALIYSSLCAQSADS